MDKKTLEKKLGNPHSKKVVTSPDDTTDDTIICFRATDICCGGTSVACIFTDNCGDADCIDADCSVRSISGPITVAVGNDYQYTYNNPQHENVTWSVIGAVGSGGGIDQDGLLTVGSGGCGTITVSAKDDCCPTAIDYYITVPLSGMWSSAETECQSGGFSCGFGEFTSGWYEHGSYRNKYTAWYYCQEGGGGSTTASCNGVPSCSNEDGYSVEGQVCDTPPQLSKYVHISELVKSYWVCAP